MPLDLRILILNSSFKVHLYKDFVYYYFVGYQDDSLNEVCIVRIGCKQ